MIGAHLQQYQITRPLGAGGMGEVFCARDTRLNREVALKLLPKTFASDPGRLRRFEQEVTTLAALNHPNILTIHDSGVHDGAPYLVSELLEGQTLRELLSGAGGAALPLRRASDYALQIAQGLAAAHSKGIVHRDLKPENIFVTRDGRVKILDFGLAKLQLFDLKSHPGEAAPTVLESTEPGLILGTPAYMAPEQVRGEPADHRSDIFAFGCVLYEMLSGKRPFKRHTAVESMNAVLRETPDEMTEVPFGMGRIAHRCLEKQPEHRFQSAQDLAFAIESARTGSIPAQAPLRSNRTYTDKKGLIGWAVAALAILFALATLFRGRPTHSGAGIAVPSSATQAAPLLKLEIRVPAPVEPGKLAALKGLAISPDGRKLAYLNDAGLWWRWLDRLGPPTLLSSGEKVAGPFWSPDSTDLGWDENGSLMRAAIAGGQPAFICRMTAPFSGGGAAWCAGGEIIFTQGGTGLLRVPAQGGNTELVLPPGEGELDFHEAAAMPGGRGVVFVIHHKQGGPDTVAAWNPKDKKSGPKILLHQPGSFFSGPTVSCSGHVLCVDQGARGTEGIWAIPISFTTLENTGEALHIPDQGGLVSASAQGTLVLSSPAEDLEAFRPRKVVWVNRSGSLSSPVGSAWKGLKALRLSPDEGAIAIAAGDRLSGLRVRILDAARGSELPFPERGAIECGPYWMPSGREIALTAYESGELQLLIRALDGGAPERLGLGTLKGVSPKGRYVFVDRHNQTNLHGYLDLSRDRHEWMPLPGNLTTWGAGMQQQPSLSPDETTLVYRSARGEIEAVAFPECTNRVVVASGNGQYPQWSRDGSEIFYLAGDGATMMSVPVTSTGTRRFGQPVKLFDLPDPIFFDRRWSGVGTPFDVSADGQRFLIVQTVHDPERASAASEASVLLIQNWFAEFREQK